MEVEFRRGYYVVLGVEFCSSEDAYRTLAMQWHPDKRSRTPLHLLARPNINFQEAYSVLSDRSKRTLCDADAGLYEEEDEAEGFDDFLQEMMSLIKDDRKEENSYSIEELHGMFWDMAQSYVIPD